MPTPGYEAQARARQTQLTKPPGSLGRLEDIACWFAGRLGAVAPRMPQCGIYVFAGDHGVAQRGVSAFPQSVTAQMLANFAAGGAAINVLAELSGVPVEIVNVGVLGDSATPQGVRDRRVKAGTNDLSEGPAMTVAERDQALAVGEQCARDGIEGGARLLIAGDMGIGNTTSAACLICALSNATPEQVVGRGTGVDDEAFARKREIVKIALARIGPVNQKSALEILGEVGGLEIAAMAGFYIQAARMQVPVLLDGFISTAAALVAVGIDPSVRDWMLASHRSAETGHVVALAFLEMQPILDLNLRLGEGSGAALALPIVRAALSLHRDMATFEQAGVATAVGESR